MKKRTVLKSAAALALAVVMLLALALPAFASSAGGGGSITINPNGQAKVGGPTRFTAYQIFSGTVGAADPNELVNLTWGSGVDYNRLLTELQSSTLPLNGSTFGAEFKKSYDLWNAQDPSSGYSDEISDAEFVAQWLAKNIANTAYADDFARIAAKHTSGVGTPSKFAGTDGADGWIMDGLTPGYYLVVDNYKSGEEVPDGSVSSYILQVIGNAKVDLKATIPYVEKKVDDVKGVLTETEVDHKFTLTGTVSENIAEYDTYSYEFVDHVSPGLTPNTTGLIVTCNGKQFTKGDGNDYTVGYGDYDGHDGWHTITVKFTDLKQSLLDRNMYTEANLSDTKKVQAIKIVVTYTAKLNENAVVTDAGNPNDVTLRYANDPYEEGTGESTPDEVKTYTLALRVIKHDENNKPMSGVEFKLMNSESQYATFKSVVSPAETYQEITGWVPEEARGTALTTDSSGVFNIHGLSAGTYTLVETKTPADYETMKPVVFTIAGSVNDKGDLGEITLTRDPSNQHRQDVEWNNHDFKTHNAQLTLTNFKSPILPHTGGMGAKVVYIVSGLTVLAGAAIVVMAMRKRTRGRHEQSR